MSNRLEDLKAALEGRYEIEKELGHGGMATVYLARDVKHNREVAVKVLRPDLAEALGAERFLREIEIAANLHHPHILPLYESGNSEGFLYYTMPFVEGESLRDRLDREKQLPVEDAQQIAGEVADALGYAHSRGVVHRDIKPGNIMLGSGHALVADFGIARAITAAESESLTETGLAIGTPTYMSPEQASGDKNLDGRSDVYSLGCVLHEMLAGEPPHTGPTAQAIIAKRLTEPVSSLRIVRDTVPEGVNNAVLRSLAKVPADRFATAEQFRSAVIGSDEHFPTRSEGAPFRWKRWAIVAAILGVAWAGWQLMPFENENEPASLLAADPGVAVLPFRTVETDLEYLGEGMVDLLSDNLDGVDGLRKIPPTTVMIALRKANGGETDEIEPHLALEVARSVGARYVVTGSVIRSGGEVRLVAEVRGADGGERRGSHQVEGLIDSVYTLVDDLTMGLLGRNLLPTGAQQSVGRGRVMTSSLDALKAYLAGESEYRLARWSAAAQHFETAFELDTTFARAAYRLSLAYSWGTGQHELSEEWAERAAQLADRLPERDAMLLRGRLSSGGNTAILEDFTARYPDHAEGWAGLGDTYFHFGGRKLTPTRVFVAAMETAVALNPNFAEPYLHLVENSFAQLDSTRAAELVAVWDSSGFGSSTECKFQTSYDLVWGSENARDRAISMLDSIPSGIVLSCVQSAMAAPPRALDKLAEKYREVMDSSLDSLERTVALWRLLQVHVPRGQIAAARRDLDRVERVPTTGSHAARWQIMLHLSGFPDSIRANRAAVKLTANGAATDLFWVGALAVEDGRWENAEQIGRSLDSLALQLGESDLENRKYAEAFGDALLEYMAMVRGGVDSLAAFEEALGRLVPASFSREQPQQWLRYMVGSILVDAGRFEDAKRYFASFQPYDYFYTSLAELFLGRIQEALGRPDEAITHYNRFVTWWQYADPELSDWRDEARDALVRLGGDGAR